MDTEIDSDVTIDKKMRTPRIFHQPLLESLTKSNIIIVSIVYLPVVCFFWYQSTQYLSTTSILLNILVGLFIWGFAEYCIHRFVFHFVFENERLKKIHAVFHLLHHKYIHDAAKYPTLLIASLPGGLLFFYMFQFIFGVYGLPVFCGFVLGYLIYEFVHYSTHTYQMNFPIGKLLKQHHMRHHYFNFEQNFGVTSPLWDYVFRSKIKNIHYAERKIIQ